MKKLMMSLMTALGMALFLAVPALACTSYYVGPKCTADGTAMYGRTEDTTSSWDKVFKVIEAKEVGPDAMYADPTGATRFQAPLNVEKTFRYTIMRDAEANDDGFFGEAGQNECGVSMSATTSSSPATTVRNKDAFVRGTGITEENLVDYVLCQVSTAREGVELLKETVATIGAGEGNGLFIADNKEVWYVEILTGHQMVALRMPEDKAMIAPNCFVIDAVDTNDTANVICTDTLVSFAEENGFLVVPTEKAGNIDVKASYAPKYSAGNADRIRGGEFLLAGVDSEEIYTVVSRDMFFDCKNVTLEKVYQLAGYRYEGMDFGTRKVSRQIGVSSTVEAHIFQITPNMPAEIATVQWMSMKSPAYTMMAPFYTALMTDTPASWKIEAAKRNDDATFWASYDLYNICNSNQDTVGVKVKDVWKDTMIKLEVLQKKVNKDMLQKYKSDRANLEYYATDLGCQIGEEVTAMTKALLADANAYVAAETEEPFVPSIGTAAIDYKMSMVHPPQSQKGKENNNGKGKANGKNK